MSDMVFGEEIKSLLKNTIINFTNHQKTIFLQDLKHPDLILKKPIPIFIEYDENSVVANYYDTESFGYGESEYEAINDLCLELEQTYLDLEADSKNLGDLPTKWWNHLQSIIKRKSLN